MKKEVIVFLALILFITFLFVKPSRQDEVEKYALEDLGLQMWGVVESFENVDGFHGYGIIRLKVINSNIMEYDPRGRYKYYFCIIKGNKAEVYDHASRENTFIGDTLFYDTKKKIGARFRNGLKVQEGAIHINKSEGYYNFIRKRTVFR